MARGTLRQSLSIFAMGLAFAIAAARPDRALARNCPSVSDALVVVAPDGPTPFTLPVTNGENADVTVFQFPLGGQVLHVGPTAIDYVFIPDASFDGRATLRFRVSADNDCGGGTMVGAVTLAGGTIHQPVPGGAGGLIGEGRCGVGVLGVTLMAQFGVLLVVAAQRWRRV